MDGRVGALALDRAEHRAGLGLDDGEDVRARRAEAEARGRVVAAGPDVARVGLRQLGVLGGAAERLGAEDLRVCVVERSLERGGGHVPVEHARVLVVEDRRLHAPAEKRLAARA